MRANFEMNASLLDLRELAFSTSSSIFDAVDSPNSFVVLIFSSPVSLMQPLMTSSPTETLRGRLSPVSAAVFSTLVPSVITPSMGIFSPGCTTMTVPTAISSGSWRTSCPFSSSMLA